MQPLDNLLAGDFLATAFDAEPLILRAGTQAWADIVTLDDVEYLVRTAPASGDWLQLAKCGGFLPLSGSLVSGVSVRTSAIRKRVAQGFSLVLNHVRQRLRSVDAVCATIESAVERRAGFALKYPISSNLYATPPESAAFVPHYDGHGVLVFQLSGSKRWQIFSRMNAEAVEALPRIDTDLGDPVLDVVLRNGDALYVPRGYPHCAQTTDTHSIHLTLGLQCYTGSDLAWARAHGIRPGEYVPRHLLENAGTGVRARLRYERTFVDACRVTETLIAPRPGTGVRRSPRDCVIMPEDEHVVLAFPGGAGRFPRHFERALRATAAQGDGASAPDLSEEEQRDMRTALYQMGFLSAGDR